MDLTAQAPSNQSLLDILVSERLLTPAQLNDIKLKVAAQGVTEESIISANRMVSEENMAEAKARMLGIPFVAIENASFSPEALGLISEAVVQRFNLIPFLFDRKTNTLSIAMGNPVDLDAISFPC